MMKPQWNRRSGWLMRVCAGQIVQGMKEADAYYFKHGCYSLIAFLVNTFSNLQNIFIR